MDTDKIIDRVRKLFAMAESTDNQAEAEAFMAKAQELLNDYNLSEVDIAQEEKEQDIVKVVSTFKYPSALWKMLAGATARLYFSQLIMSQRWDPKMGQKGGMRHDFVFVGREHNATVAKSMFEYLAKTVIRLSQKHTKVRKEQLEFERACISGLCARLRLLKDDAIKAHAAPVTPDVVVTDAPTGNALVALYVSEEEAITAALQWLFENGVKDGKKGRKVTIKMSEAGLAGKAAAKEISLNAQVGTGSGAKLIGNS